MFQLANEKLSIANIASKIIRCIYEHFAEEVSAPLDAVFDLVGEVPERAHGDRFFGRVLRVSVTLGLVRDHHLGVCFSSESSRFKEGFLVPDASLVDVESGFDVVHSVYYEVEAFPERVVENGLRFWGH